MKPKNESAATNRKIAVDEHQVDGREIARQVHSKQGSRNADAPRDTGGKK